MISSYSETLFITRLIFITLGSLIGMELCYMNKVYPVRPHIINRRLGTPLQNQQFEQSQVWSHPQRNHPQQGHPQRNHSLWGVNYWLLDQLPESHDKLSSLPNQPYQATSKPTTGKPTPTPKTVLASEKFAHFWKMIAAITLTLITFLIQSLTSMWELAWWSNLLCQGYCSWWRSAHEWSWLLFRWLFLCAKLLASGYHFYTGFKCRP